MWILQTAEAAEPRLTFRISNGSVKTIGRGARADFVLDQALVSRIHCRLTASGDELEVHDLSSTNGTFVNGKRVKHAVVKSGDRLRLGRTELDVERLSN